MSGKYNYIIAGGAGFYKVAYSELINRCNVRYFENYIDGIQNPFIKFLTRLNFNLKVNKWIKTPFRSIVYRKIFSAKFDTQRPLCFIFFGVQFAVINTSYIEFLRKKFPTAKFVLYMQDIVSSLPYYDINNYKDRFDLVLSYDKDDCVKYGLTYYPTPFSYIDPSLFKKVKPVDIFFCGAAKTRYNKIFEIYRACKQKGLTCKFFITGVPESDKIISEDIIYDKRISYIENLSYVYYSKCVLEIMQSNAVGFTPRLWEALFYGKHLLTNNRSILDSEFYNIESIHFVDDIDDIDSWISRKPIIESYIIEKKNPSSLLNLVETLI